MPRAQLPTWLKAVMDELTMMEPVRREFLVDPELRAVQVIDLLAVGLGKAPSPGAYPLDLGGAGGDGAYRRPVPSASYNLRCRWCTAA